MGNDGDTKERLRTAARSLYLEGGVAHFSLREVARRVGVSAPAVYRHYPSKEALFAAVCQAGFQVFSSYLVRALSASTPKKRLRESATQYLAFATERPSDYRVIFLGAADGFVPDEPNVTDSATFQFLVDRVRECVEAKVLAKGDETEIATMIWAHVHGLVALRLTGHLARLGDDEAFARFYGAAVDHFISGLAPRKR